MSAAAPKQPEAIEKPASEGKKSADDIEKETLPTYELPGVTEEAIRSGSVVPEQILKHSHDADEALKAFSSYQGQVIHIDEETNKILLRRIDWNLMPVC
jgi:ACS family allantoate permease-like MFS transporter